MGHNGKDYEIYWVQLWDILSGNYGIYYGIYLVKVWDKLGKSIGYIMGYICQMVIKVIKCKKMAAA